MSEKANPYDRMSEEELDLLKGHIERFDTIGRMDPDLREFVQRRWPELFTRGVGREARPTAARALGTREGTTMMDLTVFQDRVHPGEWRVEYFDRDGGCYVTIFSGPAAEERASAYHAALSSRSIDAGIL